MHPVLFQIGDFVVGTYGLMIAVGLLAGLALSGRVARRQGVAPEFVFDLAFVLLASGLIGARVFYLLLNWGEFVRQPLAMIFSRQGFVFLGGFVVALAAGVWFTRRRRVPLADACDVVAPGLVLAHAFGRVGCFFAGCCYGCVVGPESNALARWLAVRFPLVGVRAGEMFNFAWHGQIAQGLLPPDAPAPLPVLPVQLFEAAGNALICLALLWLWRRRRYPGQVFAAYLVLYGVLRFGLEFLRGDVERGLYWHGRISTSQIISLGIIGCAAALHVWGKRRRLAPQSPAGAASLSLAAAPAVAAKSPAKNRKRRRPVQPS